MCLHCNCMDMMLISPQGIASVDAHGFQVLHHACSKGLEKMATQILSRDVSVDVLGGKLNQTPLMLGES